MSFARGAQILVGIAALLLAGAAPAAPAPVTAKHHMVVSAHPLASQAGLEILDAGGNAVDAAVATSLALSVVEPYSSGLGGGGFALVWSAADKGARALDFREVAPAAASRDMYLRAGAADTALSQTGGLAVGVPGLIRGLVMLHEGRGKLPWARVVEPAIRLARGGFVVTPLLRARIGASRLRMDAAARAVFMPGGSPPAVGDRLIQADLATTLQAVRDHGAAGFYEGPVAARIAEATQAAGGVLTAADLAAYEAKWRAPIHGDYRGATIWSMPPPSSGGVHLVQMLRFLAGFDLTAAGHGKAATVHPMIEAMKIAYADRSRLLGDPDFVDVPVARLTSDAYAASWRARFSPDRALLPSEVGGVAVAPEPEHTTHFSVVDGEGNAVACTQTINLGFGSGVLATGTGVVLNDEMDDFSAAPGVPNAFGLVGNEANAVAPRKRPLSSMTPTIVTQDGAVRLVVGSPGGSRIITTVLQVVLNVLDHGMDVAAAVAAPRIHHQWSPPDVLAEPGALAPPVRARLEALGHKVVESNFGTNVQAIERDPKTGALRGASDPRGEGAPAGR